jgi:hypothetical protein
MTRFLSILVALGGIIALYGHLVGMDQGLAAPIALALSFGALSVLAVSTIMTPGADLNKDINRPHRLASPLFWSGVVWGIASVALSLSGRNLTIQDIGVIFLVLLMPFFVLFADRKVLFKSILQVCLVVALIDAAANLLALLDLIQLDYTARVDESGLRTRYPGLSGNTHAAGLVAFIAIFYLTALVRRDGFARSTKWIVLGVILLISLIGIDARRYLAMALMCVGFLIPVSRRVPLIIYVTLLVSVMVGATFSAPAWDTGNYLRASLMINGWYDSLSHPLIGQGLFYRDGSNLLPTFDSLSVAGVTESMVLEFCIAFGMFGTVLFFMSPISLVARSKAYTPMIIVLSLMTAEMFFGGALRGLLGATLYYCCLLGCLREDDSLDLLGMSNVDLQVADAVTYTYRTT